MTTWLSGSMSHTALSPTAARRLLHELAALHKEAHKDEHVVELGPSGEAGEDLSEWRAVLVPSRSGPYAGGRFILTIRVPATYPLHPPVISFATRIFHPNVHWRTGELCLDVLQNQWTPVWTLQSACTAIVALLDDPEPDSPLNVDAANLARTGDSVAYTSVCQLYTRRYALSA